MPLLKAGIIGCGRIAGIDRREYTHAEAYARHPDVSLVAAYDINPKQQRRFRARWKIPTDNYLDNLDIVSICTPDDTHIDYLALCLTLPKVKAVWCEKPISKDYEAACDIARKYKGAGKALCVNYQRRWAEEFQEKDVKYIEVNYTGTVWENGCHGVDLCLYMKDTMQGTALICLDQKKFHFEVVVDGKPIENRWYDLYPILDDIVNNRPLRSNGFTAAETTKVCQCLLSS